MLFREINVSIPIELKIEENKYIVHKGLQYTGQVM